jgi:hypothetical protein
MSSVIAELSNVDKFVWNSSLFANWVPVFYRSTFIHVIRKLSEVSPYFE